MKKLMYVAVCLAALVACSKEQEQVQKNEPLSGKETVLATAKDFIMSGTTKTTITQSGSDAPAFAWKEGDIIGIIPMNGKTVQSNYEISEIGSNPKNATFDGGVWALKEGKEYAAYYPFKKEALVSNESLEFSFLRQTQSANNSLEHLGAYDYMYASAVVPQSGSAQFDFEHKISLVQLQLTVPKSDTFTRVVLESSAAWFANGASLKLSDGNMTATETVKSATINLNDIAISSGGVLTVWFATLPTSALSGQTLSVRLFGGENTCTGEISGIATLAAGRAYSYAADLISGGQEEDSKFDVITCVIDNNVKTILSSDNFILWSESDSVIVTNFEKEGNFTYYLKTGAREQSATFQANGTTKFKDDDTLVALFDLPTLTDNTYMWLSEQKFSEGMSDLYCPMIATRDNGTQFTFCPAGGYIFFRLTGTGTVSSVEFSADECLSGPVTVNDSAEISLSAQGVNSILLDCGAGIELSTTEYKVFKMAVPSNDYHNIAVKITGTDGKQVSKKSSTPMSIKRRTILNLNLGPIDISGPTEK